MVTLRTFPNQIDAALAKSRLDERNIPCSLEDEGVNAWGGAPFAMPVRLMVPEEHAKEALRVLSETGSALPDDFDQPNDAAPRKKEEDINEEILSELRELRQRHWWMTLSSIAALILILYLIFELPRRTISPWTEVTRAMRRNDFGMALGLAKPIVERHPRDYYGHEYLGDIYLAMDDLANAEAEYTRALELTPPESVRAKLARLQRLRGQSPAAGPSLSPPP